MNKEQLELRIEALKKEKQRISEQAVANINVLQGAIQDCEHWISEIEKQKEEPKKLQNKKVKSNG